MSITPRARAGTRAQREVGQVEVDHQARGGELVETCRENVGPLSGLEAQSHACVVRQRPRPSERVEKSHASPVADVGHGS